MHRYIQIIFAQTKQGWGKMPRFIRVILVLCLVMEILCQLQRIPSRNISGWIVSFESINSQRRSQDYFGWGRKPSTIWLEGYQRCYDETKDPYCRIKLDCELVKTGEYSGGALPYCESEPFAEHYNNYGTCDEYRYFLWLRIRRHVDVPCGEINFMNNPEYIKSIEKRRKNAR
jgi:hypothetical protein